MGLIYKATNKMTGKAYIGQTIGDLSHRQAKHYNDAKRFGKTYFHRAINKYGKSAFTWSVVVDGIDSLEELNRLEAVAIDKYKTMAPYGYNLVTGGMNRKASRDASNNMSIAQKRRYAQTSERLNGSWRSIEAIMRMARKKLAFGRIKSSGRSDSIRMASGCIRDSKRRVINGEYRKYLNKTDPDREKKKRENYSKAHKRLFENPEYAAKMKVIFESRRGSVGRRVICIDTDVIYNNVCEAARLNNTDPKSIRNVCNGKYKRCHGHRYQYA